MQDRQPGPSIRAGISANQRSCLLTDANTSIQNSGSRASAANRGVLSGVIRPACGSGFSASGCHRTGPTWLEKSAAGVHGDEDHPEFPGCMADRGFMTKLAFDSAWTAPLYRGELDELAQIRDLRDRFMDLYRC